LAKSLRKVWVSHIAFRDGNSANTFAKKLIKIAKIIQSIESQEKARVPGSKRINTYKTNINNEISIKEELYDKIIALNK